MAKKPVTKIDPRKELSPYLNHEFNQQKNSRKGQAKISASLSSLQAERRRSLRRRLGLIMTVSILAVAGLGYYISPLANISTVKVITKCLSFKLSSVIPWIIQVRKETFVPISNAIIFVFLSYL